MTVKCYNNSCPGHHEGKESFCCKPYYRDNLDKCRDAMLFSENEKKPDTYYSRILLISFCFCGRRKDRDKAFCYKCHNRLPVERKRLLDNNIGEGFGEGYDSCRRYLEVEINNQTSFLKSEK